MQVIELAMKIAPFAIFGIKGLLRELIATPRHTNAILIDIAKGLRDGTWPQDAQNAGAPDTPRGLAAYLRNKDNW